MQRAGRRLAYLVSIHARAERATIIGFTCPKCTWFQSTHAQSVRLLSTRSVRRIATGFNPRTRRACDVDLDEDIDIDEDVSIHARAERATRLGTW